MEVSLSAGLKHTCCPAANIRNMTNCNFFWFAYKQVVVNQKKINKTTILLVLPSFFSFFPFLP